METFALYLIKVSACLIVFYALYAALFARKTFFTFNRIYLLFALIASMVIPAVNFSIDEDQYPFDDVSLSPSFLEPENYWQAPNLQLDSSSVSIMSVPKIIYISGVLLLTARFLFFLFKMIGLKNKNRAVLFNDLRIVRTKISHPFTFFNIIFLPEEETNSLIISHEGVHVKQFHWIDLLVVELLSIILWFNPVLILYRRSLKLQHEYLADSNTIESGIPIEQYFDCLLNEIYSKNINYPISHFYSNSIKKRINMLTKTKMSGKVSLIYLLLFPVLCFLLLSFSFSTSQNAMVENSVSITTLQDGDVPSLWPVEAKNAKINSEFGMRMHPTLLIKKLHTGIDLFLPEGEIILSTANGLVIESASDGKRGIYLLIKHNDVFTTAYFHLKSVAVKEGDKILKGQTIGYSGSTGLSTAPHLHYEVIKNGTAVDPKDFLSK
jgi:beta-lactamase regulating signal transducer with metallopeptidase domain